MKKTHLFFFKHFRSTRSVLWIFEKKKRTVEMSSEGKLKFQKIWLFFNPIFFLEPLNTMICDKNIFNVFSRHLFFFWPKPFPPSHTRNVPFESAKEFPFENIPHRMYPTGTNQLKDSFEGLPRNVLLQPVKGFPSKKKPPCNVPYQPINGFLWGKISPNHGTYDVFFVT